MARYAPHDSRLRPVRRVGLAGVFRGDGHDPSRGGSTDRLGQRRKALLWIAAGIPVSLGARPGASPAADALTAEWTEVLVAAGRANVNIYGLDPGGLRGESIDLHVGPTTRMGGDLGPQRAGPATRESGLANRRFLRDVSENSGGFAVTGDNDPGPGIAQIFAETGSYYLLGYQSSSAPSSGKPHTLDVRVNRPGLTVRHRSAYSAAPAGRSHASKPDSSLLTGALQALLPARGVGLRASAAPFLVDGRKHPTVAVALEVEQATPVRRTVVTDRRGGRERLRRARRAGRVRHHARDGAAARGRTRLEYKGPDAHRPRARGVPTCVSRPRRRTCRGREV